MVCVTGFSEEDPNLQARMDFTLFENGMNDGERCTLLKPELFIDLSELDVTEPKSKQILLHPLLLSYLHIYSQS